MSAERFKYLIVFIFSFLLMDFYAFQAVRTVTQSIHPTLRKIIFFSYWGITLAAVSGMIAAAATDFYAWPRHLRTYFFAFVLVLYLTKLFVILPVLLEDIYRLFRYLFIQIKHLLYGKPPVSPQTSRGIPRSEFISRLALVFAAIPFSALVYGMIKGAYDYRVHRVKLKFPNLPMAFHGFRIVQLSDIHIGSFVSTRPLERAIRMVREENPDVIFFTGDLVNDIAKETDMFMEVLPELRAPHGVYSILGNHDYGDYFLWDNLHVKRANLNRLKEIHKNLGWKLLLNENTVIEREGDSIALIGVENWSRFKRFIRYGDMKKAYTGSENFPFKILLSHDPSHWDTEITADYKEVDLTLSGHTHGMQMGVEIPGFKWSPVQYFYKHWAGLYQQGGQYLYVNRGLGFIGYPGRVGILPEITVIELERQA